MVNYRTILWGLFIIFFLTSCGQNPDSGVDLEDPVGSENETTIPNILVNATGKVYLRRVGWNIFVPMSLGTTVNPGDLIRVEASAEAEIFCGDGTMWSEGPYTLENDGEEHGIPCRSGSPPRPWPDTAALRSESDSFIPYVLTPRNSALLSETPNLSWFSLPDIENYTISILSDDQQDRPPVDVQGTTSDWPSSWAPLEEMATYVLIVEGNSISSDTNNPEHTRLGFWLLPKEEVQEVQALAGRLREQPVSEKAANILIAELYIQHGLLAEAIKLLNSIPPTERSASLWTNIGMVYLDLGLPLEAKDAFSQSLNQAQLNGELETEANSLYGLALAHRMLNEDNTANEQLQLALDIYKEIGSTEDQERVNQLLSE